MKICLSIIIALNLLTLVTAQASERGMTNKSRALFEVISAVEAARYDLPVSYEVRESAQLIAPDVCEEVVADVVVDAFEAMIEAYQVVFPDDELPYAAAIADFSTLVGQSFYTRCQSFEDQSFETLKVSVFTSLDHSFKVTFLHHSLK
ncbi:MAG: hypothetical protein CME71_08620 [Halobacteriovorax sp.]|nr:hypothetical protein [Halobacteriovorax sp.]